MPSGCPANEANNDGVTPQKLAKSEGFKDSMKELKKLTGFQDKIAGGGRPKGFAEPWAIRVRVGLLQSMCIVSSVNENLSVPAMEGLAGWLVCTGYRKNNHNFACI